MDHEETPRGEAGGSLTGILTVILGLIVVFTFLTIKEFLFTPVDKIYLARVARSVISIMNSRLFWSIAVQDTSVTIEDITGAQGY